MVVPTLVRIATSCTLLIVIKTDARNTTHAQTYPEIWARHQGRDHIFALGHDQGACGKLQDEVTGAPIKLVPFGMAVSVIL